MGKLAQNIFFDWSLQISSVQTFRTINLNGIIKIEWYFIFNLRLEKYKYCMTIGFIQTTHIYPSSIIAIIYKD